MVESLRRRFISLSMAALIIVVFAISMVINITVYSTINSQLNNIATFLLDNEGAFPKEFYFENKNLGFEISAESRFETRFFSIQYDNEEVKKINLDSIAEISYDEALSYGQYALKSRWDKGFLNHYKYVKKTEGNITTVVFVNGRTLFDVTKMVMTSTFFIAIGGLALLFIIVRKLSDKAIKPYVDNMDRQRQFVADAGHEIKTPLAVISANVDVMEIIDGENEWTEGIKDQVYRLDGLIKNLLKLANMEEIPKDKKINEEVDLSMLVKSSCEEFKVLAEQKNKTMTWQVEENISMFGVRDKLDELLSLLIENATKYALEDTDIDIKLYKIRRTTYITVTNTCKGLSEEKTDNLFDRFYRGDESHNNQIEGYGIGLSVARAIVESHKGKITAKLLDDGNKIRFMVTF